MEKKKPVLTHDFQGQLLTYESLASYNTWRVGGMAKRMYKPISIEDLSLFLKSQPENETLFWLGLGSNSLIRESGFSGTVILTQGCLMGLCLIDELSVRVEAGVSCASMARFCARNGLAGAEFWAGIPGTMGGALRMNAGCYGSETWNFVEKVETISPQGELRTRKKQDFEIHYRQVRGLGEDGFVAAICRFTKGDKAESLMRIKELLSHRAETQPTNEYNCGSVFRNPPGDYAARLIESCGLKGKSIGHALVSEKHANFIVNREGLAKAFEIEALIALVQEEVKKQRQIELIHEVHIIGE